MVKYRYHLNRTDCSPLSLTVHIEWASLSWQWCVVRINDVVIEPQSHVSQQIQKRLLMYLQSETVVL